MKQERFDEIAKVIAEEVEMERLIAEGPEAEEKALASRGYDISAAELSEVLSLLEEKYNKENSELKEDELERVAGGVIGAALVVAGVAYATYKAYVKKHVFYCTSCLNYDYS